MIGSDSKRAIAPPSWLWSLVEGPRAISEAGSLITAAGFLRRLPAGDGHAVMTLPGFLASDRSTATLRGFLADWNYDASGWELGRNIGVLDNDGRGLEETLDERLADAAAASGDTVSLIGWSLGGLLAREMARRQPQLVRSVITLGSPLGDPRATTLWRLFEWLSGVKVSAAAVRERVARLAEPIDGVASTAIWSPTDAVVAAEIARVAEGDMAENVRVPSSHLGMGYNPLVLYVIADRLRQRTDDWQPFERAGLRALFYH